MNQNFDFTEENKKELFANGCTFFKISGEEINKKDSDSKKINRYRSSLKKYCALDTLGMIEIVKKLRKVIQ